MYYCILIRSSWNSYIMLSKEAVDEFQFWLKNLESMNEKGAPLSKVRDKDVRQIEVFCDASDSGYGGHLTISSKDEQKEYEWYGIWNECESRQSSTWRELETVERILDNSVDLVKSNSVEVNSDNKNVPHILKE
ncbi:uncharacterized protein LOC134235419 [Saccostrea cucullata]|uniref:uncharacterized protein LOC134235419 n=1 Tax=Saccostrea cuccullata TaxID=36930 RepID=UPI002ED54E2E